MKIKIFRLAFIFILFGCSAVFFTKAQSMHTINIDIGRNITQTAKESGAPRFAVESHWGLTFYEIVDMPLNIPVRFSRTGYEITVKPLFSLTMSADSENEDNMAVEQISLLFSRHAAKTHDEARKLIAELLRQFTRGNWKRHLSSACPAITGRSTYLDQAGKINGTCPLDPAYHPSSEDWLELMRLANYYEWIGDGVLARLTVSYTEDARGLTYSIELEFEDFAINKRRNDAKLAKQLVEGDEKGWMSTKKYDQDMKENIERIKILEANAVRRGDQIVPRD